jgi:hypothetical protein
MPRNKIKQAFHFTTRSPFSKWPPQFRTNSTLSDFNDISYVGRLYGPEFIPDNEKFLAFQCQESIRDIIIYLQMKFRWNRTLLNLCGIVAAILKMAIDRLKLFNVGNQFGTSLSTHISNFDEIEQCWTQIWHCPISTPFHMWVDYDVPNWFRTSKNFYRSPFSKWPPQYRTISTLSDFRDIIIYPHIKFWWNRTMLNFCGIVATILKMAISRIFLISGINSGYHYLLTYQILMILDNVEFLLSIFYAVYFKKLCGVIYICF